MGRIEYAREQRKMTKQQLEIAASMARGWLSKERGQYPRIETVEKFAAALHIDEPWLRTGNVPQVGWEAIFDEMAAEITRRVHLDVDSPPASRPRHFGHTLGRKRPGK
jgi:transcriptional regulator with XRE-family HTH domain